MILIFSAILKKCIQLTDLSGEEQVLISGDVFWDCTYMMNSSNSYYYSYYKVYNIEITGMKSYLYGKK